MKRTMLLIALILTVAAGALPAAAQEQKATMHMYQVVLAKHGPAWKSQNTQEGMDLRMQLIEAVKAAAKEGLIVSAGLVNDESDVEFIIVFDVETKHEVLAILNKAPNVVNGMYTPEIYSWFATEIKPLAAPGAPK